MTHLIHFGFNDITCGDYIHAIYVRDTSKVKALLAAGQDPFECDAAQNPPFFWASFSDDVEMVQEIADAQIKRGGIRGLEPFHLLHAFPTEHPLNPAQMNCFELLFSLIPDPQGIRAIATTLWEKAVFCELPVVQFLLDKGIPAGYKREKTGNSLLHDVCKEGRMDILKVPAVSLLSGINSLNAKGQTPLRLSIDSVLINKRNEVLPCVKFLMERNASITPPLTSAERNDLEKTLRENPLP